MWRLRLSAGSDPLTGERLVLRETYRGTEAGARRRLREMAGEQRSRTVARRDTQLGAVITDWRAQAGHAPGTARNYDTALAGVPQRLLSTPVGAVEVTTLRRCVQAAVDAHGPHRGRLVHALLSGAFRYAGEMGWLSDNPMRRVRIPTVPPRADTTPTPAQVRTLVELVADDSQMRAWLLTLAVVGGRRSEVLALRWSHVDLDDAEVRIEAALDPVLGTDRAPKANQRRTVAVGPVAVAALRQWRTATIERTLAAGVALVDDPYVFTAPGNLDGSRPWRPDLATRRFRALADRAGLVGVRQHDLRHQVATALLAAGIDAKTVSGRLGHTRVATTTDLYARALPAPDRRAADVLDELLGG